MSGERLRCEVHCYLYVCQSKRLEVFATHAQRKMDNYLLRRFLGRLGDNQLGVDGERARRGPSLLKWGQILTTNRGFVRHAL